MSARTQRTTESAASEAPTRDYIETTRKFWQPHAERTLTREDAREMAHNLLGFFEVLREWTIRERIRARDGVAAPTQTPKPRKRKAQRKDAAEENNLPR